MAKKVWDGETTVLDPKAHEAHAARARKVAAGPGRSSATDGPRSYRIIGGSTRTSPEKRTSYGWLIWLIVAFLILWTLIWIGRNIHMPNFGSGYYSAEPAPQGHFPKPLTYPHEWKQP